MCFGTAIAFGALMNLNAKNRVSFIGEVVEIIKDQATVKICVSYEPSILVFNAPKGSFKLGDKVQVSGDLLCGSINNIENLDYINKNFKTNDYERK